MKFGTRVRRFVRGLKGVDSDFVEIQDRVSEAPQTEPSRPIPQQLFQTGKSRMVHPKHASQVEQTRLRNPEMSFFFLDDSAAKTYMESAWTGRKILDIYRRSLIPQMRADILRYCLIHDRGGYYLDLNKTVSAPFASLHADTDEGLISFERNSAIVTPPPEVARRLQQPRRVVLQWAFGFSPSHPILETVISLIENSADFFTGDMESARDAVVMFTGPGAFTAAVRNYANNASMELVAQAGIDFHHQGILRVHGSNLTAGGQQHYTQMFDRPILASN